jgi:protein SCO1/2
MMKQLYTFVLFAFFLAMNVANAQTAGLIDQNGKAIGDDLFSSKVTLLFFGYTSCPDFCPTTLMEITNVLKVMGADADKVQAVFASVDPERDTPEKLRDYLSNFDRHIIALTGSPLATANLAKQWHVYTRKIESQDGSYMMDHTASVFLIDKHGQMLSTIDLSDAAAAAKKVRAVL